MRTLVAALLLVLATAASAAGKEEIDAEVKEAVANFYRQTSAGEELAKKASGMLIFPNVIKAGIGVGGEFGEGALLVKGKTVGYYNIAAASIGSEPPATTGSRP